MRRIWRIALPVSARPAGRAPRRAARLARRAYLGSLTLLFISAFWTIEPFSGDIVTEPSLENFETIISRARLPGDHPADSGHCGARHRNGHRAGVSRSPTTWHGWLHLERGGSWSSRSSSRSGPAISSRPTPGAIILSEGGILNWILGPAGLKGPGFGDVAVWLVFSYLWLPYMILPIYAGLERIPGSLLEASADLGARGGHTFRRIVLPLALPAVVAGSIFTFSLTLGDYIVPSLMSSSQFIGNVVYSNISVNQPLAAAYALVPVAIMIVYLAVARRLGAFEAL